jgi:hypothetical protein
MLAAALLLCSGQTLNLGEVATSQSAGDLLNPKTLGRLRSTFGEVYRDPYSDYERRVSFYAMDSTSTRMLFPAKRADRRYYFTRMEDFNGWLVMQTKSKRRINVAWLVELRPVAGESHKVGTLERYLASRGLEVKPPITAFVQQSLSAVKPFAEYHAAVPAGLFFYGFIASDGAYKRKDGQSVELGNSLPNTGFAYPISPEERELLKGSRTSPR